MTRMTSAIDRWPRSFATVALIGAAVVASTHLVAPRNAIAQRAAPITITAAVIGVTVSIWPAIVARDRGFFEEEGLRIDFVTSGASARSIQQVGAGVAHIGSSSMVDTVRAIDAGGVGER